MVAESARTTRAGPPPWFPSPGVRPGAPAPAQPAIVDAHRPVGL